MGVEIGVRLFLLTDLLLICRQFTQEEKVENPLKEFWLLFPPLSGRHLTLNDVDDEDGGSYHYCCCCCHYCF